MSRATALVLLALASSGMWHAVAFAEPEAPAAAPAPPPPQQIYKYKTKDGRVVYTNILDEVPPEQRQAGKVDLSKVALNTSVGNDLNKRLAVEHDELAASPYCEELKQEAAKSELQQLWDDHAVPIICGSIIALLIFMTPMMIKRVNAQEWARVLSKAIPTLFLVGGAMYGMQLANRKATDARQQAKPCLKETFDGLETSSDPAAGQLSLVEQLKRDIAAAQAMAEARNTALDDLAKER